MSYIFASSSPSSRHVQHYFTTLKRKIEGAAKRRWRKSQYTHYSIESVNLYLKASVGVTTPARPDRTKDSVADHPSLPIADDLANGLFSGLCLGHGCFKQVILFSILNGSEPLPLVSVLSLNLYYSCTSLFGHNELSFLATS